MMIIRRYRTRSPFRRTFFSNDVSFDNTIDDVTETAAWPETKPQESTPAQENDNVTGNDVEQRLDELFTGSSDNESNESNDIQTYQEAVEELEISDDDQSQTSYMMSELENSMEDNQPQEYAENVAEPEQLDNLDVESDFSATINDEPQPGIDNGAPLSGIDSKDKPYSIPDHVLTPTLADIYFQQGQYQLSLQIYSRLIEKDPSNMNLQDRYDEIQTLLANQENQPGQFYNFGNDSESGQDQSRGRKKSSETDKPLSGVRIKKNKKKK